MKRIFRLSGRAFIAIALVSCNAQAALCNIAIGKDFPVGQLEEAGLNASALVAMNEEIDAKAFEVRSLLILHRCKLVFERYAEGVSRDQNHALYSVSKLITTLAVGRAVQEGKILSLNTPLGKLIKRPLFVGDGDWAKLDAISIGDALRLRSGIEWKHDVSGNPVHSYSADMLRDGVQLPIAASAGTRFNYSDYDAALAGFALADVAGTDLPSAAQALLYQPLQIQGKAWDFQDRLGRYSGGFGARLRPMDMLKLGQLVMQSGSWNGAQLVPALVIDEMVPRPAVLEKGFFSAGWWVGKNPDLGDTRFYFAAGRKGQRIYVFPEWDLVVALTAALHADDEQLLFRPLVRHLGAISKKAVNTAEALEKAARIQRAGFRGTRGFVEAIDQVR